MSENTPTTPAKDGPNLSASTTSAPSAPMTPKELLRSRTRGIYDLQKLRISMGNRLCAQFATKLGIDLSKKRDDESVADCEGDDGADDKGLDDGADGKKDDGSKKSNKDKSKVLKALRESYRTLTEGLVKTRRELPVMDKFKGDALISHYAELCLVSTWLDTIAREESEFRRLEPLLREFKIWSTFLEAISGVGPAMGAVLISELDPRKANYPSSFWKFAGLDVALATDRDEHGQPKPGAEPRMKGRSRVKDHLRTIHYIDKSGKPATRQGVTFNPFLKTKLFVLADCLIKRQGDAGRYKQYYNNYKHRLECTPRWAAESKGHRNMAAKRYMIKMFLLDLWKVWRELEGLPTPPSYAEAKLGMVHHGTESPIPGSSGVPSVS